MRARLAALALVTLAPLGACSSHRSHGHEVDAERAARLLVDRDWIDVMPEGPKDRLHVYRFTPRMGGGVYQDRTVFRGEFELFTFKATKSELGFTFPDTGERYRTGYKIEEDLDGPAPFDLRLTLDRSPRGPRVYYGRSEQRGDLDTLLATHGAE